MFLRGSNYHDYRSYVGHEPANDKINYIRNCSIFIVLTAMGQNSKKSLKSDVTRLAVDMDINGYIRHLI